MVRPSVRSTVKASPFTFTDWARVSSVSTAKELIPTLKQPLLMLRYKLRKHIQFMPGEAPGTLQGDRLQPELRDHVRPSDVNAGWLGPIQ